MNGAQDWSPATKNWCVPADFQSFGDVLSRQNRIYASVFAPQSALKYRIAAATSRLMKAIDKLRIENVQPRVPGLELFAIARTLVCVSVNMTGVDPGLKDAQYVFEAVLDDLAPMLREMPNLGS